MLQLRQLPDRLKPCISHGRPVQVEPLQVRQFSQKTQPSIRNPGALQLELFQVGKIRKLARQLIRKVTVPAVKFNNPVGILAKGSKTTGTDRRIPRHIHQQKGAFFRSYCHAQALCFQLLDRFKRHRRQVQLRPVICRGLIGFQKSGYRGSVLHIFHLAVETGTIAHPPFQQLDFAR